jgi:hypothetical protein
MLSTKGESTVATLEPFLIEFRMLGEEPYEGAFYFVDKEWFSEVA